MPPSLSQRTEVATDGGTGFLELLRRFVTIFSNSTQVVGVLLLLQPATSMPRFARSVGTIMAKLGARNDVPHEPLKVRSSIGLQLNASLGLLVPPTSLYWS